jgi:hypothetical protein
MLTADTALEVWTYRATLLDSHTDELAYTLLVKYLEWIDLEDLLVEVNWEEAGDIVT